MRLVIQAQSPAAQVALHAAFPRLPTADKEVLTCEMALSGVAGEAFSLAAECRGGPAFLVYYSPAFLQHLAPENALVALLVLADVYRSARAIWPLELTPEAEGRTVTVHVGAIKGVSSAKLHAAHAQGSCWRLVQKGSLDAVVELTPLLEMARLSGGGSQGAKGEGAKGTPPPLPPRSEVLPLWAASWKDRGAALPWLVEAVEEPKAAPLPPPPKAAAEEKKPAWVSLTGAAHMQLLGTSNKEQLRRVRDMQVTGWVIDPAKSRWVPQWDLTMLLPLLFTAIITPVEISFLPEGQHISVMWLVNRVVDLMFVVDIVLTFHVAYQVRLLIAADCC